jgi:molybdopterin/thiamine biosynthesis adenylyltransferase
MSVLPGRTAWYPCEFGGAPAVSEADLKRAGPAGPVPGVIEAIQAPEALKHLLGVGGLLTDRVVVYDH